MLYESGDSTQNPYNHSESPDQGFECNRLVTTLEVVWAKYLGGQCLPISFWPRKRSHDQPDDIDE